MYIYKYTLECVYGIHFREACIYGVVILTTNVLNFLTLFSRVNGCELSNYSARRVIYGERSLPYPVLFHRYEEMGMGTNCRPADRPSFRLFGRKQEKISPLTTPVCYHSLIISFVDKVTGIKAHPTLARKKKKKIKTYIRMVLSCRKKKKLIFCFSISTFCLLPFESNLCSI